MTASTSSGVALASSQTISMRGIIIEPTCLSSSRNTLRTIWCSCSSITPASTLSSRLAASSSSVTVRLGPPRTPISRKVASVHHDSSLTKGRAISESHSIGCAASRATVSGYICPIRLGTNSPKMIVRKVIAMTTIAVAVMAAARAWIANVALSQCANGSENAASPTMPFRMPIDVMPICTTERNLVGLSCRSIAACAPASPASTITCSRALRLAVSAISDMANNAFSRIRKTSRATSMRGVKKGKRGA